MNYFTLFGGETLLNKFILQGNMNYFTLFGGETLFNKLWPLLVLRAELDLRSTNTFLFPGWFSFQMPSEYQSYNLNTEIQQSKIPLFGHPKLQILASNFLDAKTGLVFWYCLAIEIFAVHKQLNPFKYICLHPQLKREQNVCGFFCQNCLAFVSCTYSYYLRVHHCFPGVNNSNLRVQLNTSLASRLVKKSPQTRNL